MDVRLEQARPTLSLVILDGGRSIRLQSLADVKNAFSEALRSADKRRVSVLGLLAALFAVAGLQRSGTALGRSNLARVLDQFYFVAPSPEITAEFERSLEHGIDLAQRAVVADREAELLEVLFAECQQAASGITSHFESR
jgi:hypothetical protein